MSLHGLFFLISSKGFLDALFHNWIVYTMVFGIPVVKYWLEREKLNEMTDRKEGTLMVHSIHFIFG